MMRDRLTTDGPLIPPVYSQDEPNAPIDLGSAAIEFALGSATHRKQARVRMQFLPDDRLVFVVPADAPPPDQRVDEWRKVTEALNALIDTFDESGLTLALPERRVSVDAFCAGVGGTGDVLTFTPKSSVVAVTPASNNLAECVFHLLNFPDFAGPEDYAIATPLPQSVRVSRCGRVVVQADGWQITIAATERTPDHDKALRAQGGFVITHMGTIEREDGSLFSSDRLQDVLLCVHHFLSFALGRWAGVALPIGVDRSGTRVFEQWGTPQTAPGRWNGSLSCFDRHHSEFLSATFPGFVALWRSDVWRVPIQKALYWYLCANERGTSITVDAGLILAQAALEQLAWTCCVRDRKLVSETAFGRRGLSAADKLRLLLGTLNVPAEIPASLRVLQARPGRPWVDGPEAITDTRNALVHPREGTTLLADSYWEAWQLSMWFLDMTLLRLCGYNGAYANRLRERWTGDVEPVPWAQCASAGETGS